MAASSSSSSSSSCSSSFLFFLLFSQYLFLISSSGEQTAIKEVDVRNPLLHFLPLPLVGHSFADGAKDIVSCERVQIVGLSRLKVNSYANSFRITVKPSEVIPANLHSKIEVCFHWNASTSLCRCVADEWRTIQKGLWRSTMSPYEDRYVDVKFMDGVSGPITISLEEDFHQWRLVCLAFGFVLLLLAPILSHWLPFYYSSSMALGVLLVVLILLFQGMKFVPVGRKSILYLTIYGSVLGAGSFIVNYFSMLVKSILVSFGLSEDMYNPVSVFVLVGTFLAGAAVGYWIVRKFVLAEDGNVDVGVAQFVKWAMRITAVVSIFLSTLDKPLAMGALLITWSICHLITYMVSRSQVSVQQAHLVSKDLWQRRAREACANHKHAEFLSKSPTMGLAKSYLKSQNSHHVQSPSLIKGLFLSSPTKSKASEQDYYSTFHKTPKRNRFSKERWEEFTSQSTREALAEWASSPEFTDWIIEHADRVRFVSDESSEDAMVSESESSEDAMVSESESSEESIVERKAGISLFKWH